MLTIITNLENLVASKPANAAQKQWMCDISDWSICNIGLLYGAEYDGAMIQRHHVLGRSAKHNKIAIGHWFVLPIPVWLHDISGNSKYNVTHNKHNFTDRFGKQRDLFLTMLESMRDQGYELPPADVCEAIRKTSA